MILRRVPPAATLLGFAGLIPFYVAVGLLYYLEDPRYGGFLLYVLLLYSAIIASFVGAVHWGLAMANIGWEGQRRPIADRLNDGADGQQNFEPAVRQMMWSVIPALFGWAIVLAFNIDQRAWVALLLMIVLYGAQLYGDVQAVRQDLAPEWYLELRRPVTLAVLIALFLALFGSVGPMPAAG